MLDYLTGIVSHKTEKTVTVNVAGFGLAFMLPKLDQVNIKQEVTLFAYTHWNQDRGPSFFGFLSPLERDLFLLLIGCQNIGPQIALGILRQLDASHCLELLATGQEKALNACNGIGAKKAQQLVTQLQEKASKLLKSSGISPATASGSTQLLDIKEALQSLGYSSMEVTTALRNIPSESHSEPFDKVMRKVLQTLTQQR